MSFWDNILSVFILMYMVFLPCFENQVKLFGKIAPANIVLAMIMLTYFLKLTFEKESRKRFIVGIKDFFTDYLTIFMVILAFIMFISVSYSHEKTLAISEGARFLTYLAIYFIIKYDINHTISILRIIKTYIVTVAGISIFGIYQYFTGYALNKDFIENYGYARIKIAATLDNPNNLAAFLMIALFPILMLAIYEKRKLNKIAYSLLSILIFINIILTGSRNGLVGIVVGVAILSILYSLRLSILLAVIGAASLFLPQISERLMSIFDKTQNQSRAYLWEIAKKMIKDHPLFGVGNGNYVSLYDKYTEIYPQFAFYGYKRFSCHNTYLKVQSELGILGTVSFVGILVSALVRVKAFINNSKDKFLKFFYIGFLASMVAFYVMNLVDNLFFAPKTVTYFWILLACCDAMMFKEKNRRGGYYY